MAATTHPYDSLLKEAFSSFGEDLAASGWRGKENDCVNRFALGHLLPRCGTSVLRHPTQIGIEVGVPQPPGVGIKGAARKDLVIWPEPWMSTWSEAWLPIHLPAVVMEWKLCHAAKPLIGLRHCTDWVRSFAEWQPRALGLTVVVDLDARKHRLLVGRYYQNDQRPLWFRFPVLRSES